MPGKAGKPKNESVRKQRSDLMLEIEPIRAVRMISFRGGGSLFRQAASNLAVRIDSRDERESLGPDVSKLSEQTLDIRPIGLGKFIRDPLYSRHARAHELVEGFS